MPLAAKISTLKPLDNLKIGPPLATPPTGAMDKNPLRPVCAPLSVRPISALLAECAKYSGGRSSPRAPSRRSKSNGLPSAALSYLVRQRIKHRDSNIIVIQGPLNRRKVASLRQLADGVHLA